MIIMANNNEISVKALAGKYLTFNLGGESYGLEIMKVQEIIKIIDVTQIPKTPEFVRGVINLRGKVIPVIDLRLKFEIQAQEDTEKTCIIVMQVKSKDDTVTILGIIVDEVSEVLDIGEEKIEPSPSFGANIDTDFILGMGKVGDKVMSMLDIDKILTKEEIAVVEQAA
jgi:purine-binding chemotaxis protein CheW